MAQAKDIRVEITGDATKLLDLLRQATIEIEWLNERLRETRRQVGELREDVDANKIMGERTARDHLGGP